MSDASRPPQLRPSHGTLTRREQLLAEAERIACVGSWEWEIATNRVYWSDELYRIYGLDRSAGPLSFDSYLQRLHPADRSVAEAAVRFGFETGNPFEFEHRVIRPDGEERLLVGRGEVVRDEHGVPIRMVGTGQDVTAQREAERRARELVRAEAARAAAERLVERLAFLSDASVLLNQSLDFEATLAELARLAVPRVADWCVIDLRDDRGERRRVAVEHPDPAKLALAIALQEAYPPDPGAAFGVSKVLATGESELVEEIPDGLLAAAAKDDEHLRLIRALDLRSYLIVPLKTDAAVLGAITFVSSSDRRFDEADRRLAEELAGRAATALANASLVRQLEESRANLESQAAELEAQTEELEELMEELEVTAEELARRNEELARSEAAAQEARGTAEQANRAKSQFLAAMSHELRTPLNAIAGYSELLALELHGPVTPRQRDAVGRIQRNQQHLLALVNDVLNFAKLEAQQVSYRIEDVPVHALLSGLDALIEPQVRARGQLFTCRGCDATLSVRGDPERIEQILVNLLSNAIKFTQPGGSITVGCEVVDDKVQVHVADTGRGIDAAKLERVFEPFVQVGPQSHVGGDGVGLGLSISRDLARALSGDVTAVSQPGRGSVFTLTLPRGGVANTPPTTPGPDPTRHVDAR